VDSQGFLQELQPAIKFIPPILKEGISGVGGEDWTLSGLENFEAV
jgi:hypothetical protein